MVSGYDRDVDSKPKKKERKQEAPKAPKVEKLDHNDGQSDPIRNIASSLDLNDCYCTAAWVVSKIIGSATGKDITNLETCSNIGAVVSSIQDAHDLARTDFRAGVALYAAAGIWHLIQEDPSWEQ